jgi:hypothetical protein
MAEITERELGALEQELKEVRHDYRNLKMIVSNSGIASVSPEDVKEMRESLNILHNTKANRKNIDSLSREFNQFKTKVYTVLSVVVLLAGAVGWLIDVVLRLQ